MSKYVVLTDSTCDLPEEAAKQHNIDIVCFKIALDGEGYTERVDFTPEQFCEMLKKASGLPTTAQITQFEFFDKFEEYDRQGVEQTLYQCRRQRHERGGPCGGGAVPRRASGQQNGNLYRGQPRVFDG